MDDLIAFLRARLDNEAELARATMSRANPREGVWTFADMQIRDDAGHLVVRHTWPNEGEHIAHNDPARVLREVEAKRSVLRDLEQAEFTLSTAGPGTPPHDLMTGAVNMLRRTVRLLAVPYADHPAYRAEWRP